VASQKTSVSTLETGWQQHVQGTSSVYPLAPASAGLPQDHLGSGPFGVARQLSTMAPQNFAEEPQAVAG
jgi:hypothetical protein